jgi:CRP-like cAMP-binding protein
VVTLRALTGSGGVNVPGYDRSAFVVYLSRVPMFSKCTGAQLERLADVAVERDVGPGDAVVRQGETGEEFFVIADGSVTITRDGNDVATLGAGDYFGELALLDPAPRDATVTAAKPTNVLVIGRADFRSALDDLPTLRDAVLHGMARRIHELDTRY